MMWLKTLKWILIVAIVCTVPFAFSLRNMSELFPLKIQIFIGVMYPSLFVFLIVVMKKLENKIKNEGDEN